MTKQSARGSGGGEGTATDLNKRVDKKASARLAGKR